MALAWHLDGRVTAVVGTHTHVATADCQILNDGTAYVTDLGMVGAFDSIIGMDKEPVLERFLTGINKRLQPIVNGLMRIDCADRLSFFLNQPIIDNQSSKHFYILYVFILTFSIAVTLLYYANLDVIPINYLLSSLSGQMDISELAKLRETSTTTFKLGKLHRYRFFMAQMIPFLVIISFIKYKISRENFWRIQFYILTVFAMYRSVSDLQRTIIERRWNIEKSFIQNRSISDTNRSRFMCRLLGYSGLIANSYLKKNYTDDVLNRG